MWYVPVWYASINALLVSVDDDNIVLVISWLNRPLA
jgi:hypothetical protein